ncbi:MAG: DUF5305 domain-containing protein [Clostridiales bacterium]|nr:DUF5305 domain-containing protein [Clostridiales bacterium]
MESGKLKKQYSKRVLITICAISLAMALLACGYLGYRLLHVRRVKNRIVTVQQNELDYLVFLRENPYIERPFLPSGEHYLYSYTDRVTLQSAYELGISEPITADYTYKVTAVIVARYAKSPGSAGNPEIMSKTYVLDYEARPLETESLRLTRDYDIYLDPYKRELEAFAATVDIPVTGELRVDVTVSLDSPDNFAETYARGIAVPLSSEHYEIGFRGEERVETEHCVLERPVSLWTVMGLSALVLAGAAVCLLVLKQLFDRRLTFHRQLDRTLRAYDEHIVNTTTPIDLSAYKVLTIESFKELLHLAQKTGAPILFWRGQAEARFYILQQDLLFLFSVREE